MRSIASTVKTAAMFSHLLRTRVSSYVDVLEAVRCEFERADGTTGR